VARPVTVTPSIGSVVCVLPPHTSLRNRVTRHRADPEKQVSSRVFWPVSWPKLMVPSIRIPRPESSLVILPSKRKSLVNPINGGSEQVPSVEAKGVSRVELEKPAAGIASRSPHTWPASGSVKGQLLK
jgi:hypothetical protein